MAGTTVDNLNVLDTSSKDNTGGVEIITWTEVYNALFGTTNATQTVTIQQEFFSGALLLTFKANDGSSYTISHTGTDKTTGYQIVHTKPTGETTQPLPGGGMNEADFLSFMNSTTVGSSALLITTDIWGVDSKDVIQGISNNAQISNIIHGGTGADQLMGGAGNDIFVYSTVADSPFSPTARSYDVITNFQPGIDKIDLTPLNSP